MHMRKSAGGKMQMIQAHQRLQIVQQSKMRVMGGLLRAPEA